VLRANLNYKELSMTTHPEIAQMPTEERIRAIAYSLWEEEGRPDGRNLDHWLRASELVAAEAAAEPAVPPDTGEPSWLARKESAKETMQPSRYSRKAA
jgi:hypothetical protein